MKKKDINVGCTYRNRGAGTMTRKVLEIGDHVRPTWLGYPDRRPVDEPGVAFHQFFNGKFVRSDRLYLSSFASWAGAVVDEGEEHANA